MKRLALFLVLCLSVPLFAQPDQNSAKRAKAQELIDVLHIDRIIEQVMDVTREQVTAMTTQMVGNSATPEQKAQLATFQKQVFDFVDARMGWKVMEPDYVDLYAQTFTDEELDSIIAFYKSPVGIVMVAKTPELTQRAQALSQKRLMQVLPEMQKMIQDFARSAAVGPKTPANKSN